MCTLAQEEKKTTIAGLLLLLLASCGPGAPAPAETIDPFLAAVQRDSPEGLLCHVAGVDGSGDMAPGAQFQFLAWAASRYDAYRRGRDAGWVDLGEDGIAAVKLFGLGRGTVYELRDVRRTAADRIVARMDLQLVHRPDSLSQVAPGTTFYVCGVPAGRVHAIRRPMVGQGEESVEALDRISLEWTLVRQEPGGACPARWTVATVKPIEGTATTRRVTWAF